MNKEEKNIINAVEMEINYKFPDDFKNFILNKENLHNVRSKLFKINGEEKILRYINSFDKNSRSYIGKAQEFDSEYERSIVPFALLEFGDTLCFDRNTNKIFHYNHEEDSISEVASNWSEFYTTLYEDNID